MRSRVTLLREGQRMPPARRLHRANVPSPLGFRDEHRARPGIRSATRGKHASAVGRRLAAGSRAPKCARSARCRVPQRRLPDARAALAKRVIARAGSCPAEDGALPHSALRERSLRLPSSSGGAAHAAAPRAFRFQGMRDCWAELLHSCDTSGQPSRSLAAGWRRRPTCWARGGCFFLRPSGQV